ncbi:MAG TPA: ribonuclease HII [archaeon]|nr:ribonuclease HII [archaeon]
MTMIMGIDEAGRGALIGPLVVAGVVVSKEKEKLLKKIGVKDSKMLTPEKREKLAAQIEEIADNILVMRVQPCRIDKLRSEGIKLDKIEAMKMAEIIDMGNANKVYVDALSNNPKRFQGQILEFVRTAEPEFVVENYADETYPVVSAASIIAKVERDRVIEEIKKKVKVDFGVGYSHDERTVKFVEQLIKKRKPLPTFVRQSWITTQLLMEANLQSKIKDFFKKEEECIDENETDEETK